MRYVLMGMCWLGTMSSALAQTVTVPWTELKALVELQAKQAFEQTHQKPQVDPFRYALNESTAKVRLDPKKPTARVSVFGTVIGGAPTPIALWPKGTVLVGKATVQGGHPMQDAKTGGIAFLPSGVGEFSIQATLKLASQRIDGQHYIWVPQVPALARDTTHELAGGYHISTAPKTKAAVTEYRIESAVAAQARTTVRDINVYHRIEWDQQRLKGRSLFVVRRDFSGEVTVKMPTGARLVQVESGSAQLTKQGADTYRMQLDAEKNHHWEWDWMLPIGVDKTDMALILPAVLDNQGRADWVNFHEPDGVLLKWPATQARLPLKSGSLFPAAKALFSRGTSFRVGHEKQLAFGWERFRLAKRPELIVPKMRVFVGVEDSGQVLTRFHFTVPAGHDGRWVLQPPKTAEIWQLHVSGQKRAVYRDEDGRWVIPLVKDTQTPCEVDLAYIIKGDPLVLQGRIDLALPAIGLPAKALSVELGLPKRVNLVAMDSDLQPLTNHPACDLGKHYQGHKHAFQQNYYRGQGEALAIYYREPVKESK